MDEIKPTEQEIIRDKKGRFVKGVSGNPQGLRGGFKIMSTQVKLAFLEAFEEMGGIKAFVEWGMKPNNRKEAYKIIVSILPKDIDVKGEGIANYLQIFTGLDPAGIRGIRDIIRQGLSKS